MAILATGDEVVAPRRRRSRPGRCATPSSVSVGALVREAGGEPDAARHRPRRPRRAGERAASGAGRRSDVVVICAGSSVGMRDQTAAVVVASSARSGATGWRMRPGKPTLLADCGGVPIVGLPGNPRSALVVFRLIGMPLVPPASAAATAPPPEPVDRRARLARDLPSAAGRLDVVQVTVARRHRPTPIFGPSALLSVLTAADGYVVVPEDANGLCAGDDRRRDALSLMAHHPVHPRRPGWPRRSPRGARACAAAGCPSRLDAVRLELTEAVGRVTAEPIWATRSSPPFDAAAMDGIAVRAADTRRRERDRRRCCLDPPRSRSSTPATRCPRASTRWSCASTSTTSTSRAELRARRRALPARAVDRRGHQRHRAAAARPGTGCARSTSPPRPRRGAHRGPRAPRAGRRRSSPPATRCARSAPSSAPASCSTPTR